MLVWGILFLYSCKGDEEPGGGGGEGGAGEGGGEGGADKPLIVVPPYKDYGRGTLDFSTQSYSRPAISTVIAAFDSASEAISKNEIAYDEQLELIRGLESGYENVMSMKAISEIYFSLNSSSALWSREHKYIATNFPAFSLSIDRLYVSCANSPHRDDFEKDYFHKDIDAYAGGGTYTEELVRLLALEAEYESEYASLGTANIEITYLDKTDTVDNILAKYAEQYGTDSIDYFKIKSSCMLLYKAKLETLSAPIFLNILRVRRQIADELGYDSYSTLAYSLQGHAYSESELSSFFTDVREYILPVYDQLHISVFENYFLENSISKAIYPEVINTLYEVYGDMDSELLDIYSYMLQHKLYNIGYEADDRIDDSFTVYIANNSSPFLYMTAGGFISDYTAFANKFGTFVDMYVNYGHETSLDLTLASAGSLELLTLLNLEGVLSEGDFRYMKYSTVNSLLNGAIMNAWIACFEHIAYSLPLSAIDTDEKAAAALDEAAAEAFRTMFGSDSYSSGYKYILNETIGTDYSLISSPFCVQSSCISFVTAAEIFNLEAGEKGAGVDAFKALVNRADGLSYYDQLDSAELSNPFEDKILKSIADEIYYFILGTHFFNDNSLENGV